MGWIKTIERRGKRALIRVITAVVRTRPMTRDEVLASPIERILVIRQHNQMGDMLLAVPALRAIKQRFPGAEIAVVTARINRDVLVNNPYVARLHTYHNRNPLGALSLVRAIRAARYDIVIVLHTVSFSFTSAMLGLLSGARVRVGSTSRPFGSLLSAALYHLELPLPDADELGRMNEAEHNLYPLRLLGVETDDLAPVIVPTPAEEAWADEFMRTHTAPGKTTVVVHPGAGKIQNIWPPTGFAEVVNRLAERTPLRILAVQGPRDAAPVRAFAGAARMPCEIIARRSIGEVAAVLRRADLVLCNDTGVMHVSSAAGARTLAVFGPTNPTRWAPRCPNLYIVRAASGRLDALTPEAVYEKALGVLGLVKTAQR